MFFWCGIITLLNFTTKKALFFPCKLVIAPLIPGHGTGGGTQYVYTYKYTDQGFCLLTTVLTPKLLHIYYLQKKLGLHKKTIDRP